MRFSGMRVAIPPVELFQRGFAVEKRASWFGFMKLNRKIGFAALAYLGSLPRPGRKWFKGLFAPLNQIKASDLKRASWFGFMKLNRKIGFAALAYLGSLPRPGRKWFKGLFAPLNQIKA